MEAPYKCFPLNRRRFKSSSLSLKSDYHLSCLRVYIYISVVHRDLPTIHSWGNKSAELHKPLSIQTIPKTTSGTNSSKAKCCYLAAELKQQLSREDDWSFFSQQKDSSGTDTLAICQIYTASHLWWNWGCSITYPDKRCESRKGEVL